MSNKTIDLAKASAVLQSDSTGTDGLSPLICTHCGANSVAQAGLEKFERLRFVFLAQRPYTCLQCSHRFLAKQPLLADSKRVWVLSTALLLAALLLLKGFAVFSGSSSSGRIGLVVPDFSAPATADTSTTAQQTSADLQGLISSQDAASNLPQTKLPANIARRQAFVRVPEEQLTPEQKARRLTLAKQQSELAEQASRARVEQLQRILLPADDELESLLKIEVGYVLENWRQSWSKGDVDRYLSNYSSDFTPANELTAEAWQASRRYRIKPEKNIKLELSDFDITMLDQLSSTVVEFNQRYQSGGFVENSRKRLSLSKQQDTWKITSEVELN